MNDLMVRKSPLPWWAAGLLLGLVQVLAVGLTKPLGVSTQFVVADTQVIKQVAPEYAESHPLIGSEKYQKIGYGWWFDIGLIVGAFLSAIIVRRFKIQSTTVWWQVNRGGPARRGRFFAGFIGGIFILFGARFAHGCTSGQFASGWAQLSLAAVPFTAALFGAGMITAWLVYPKTPSIDK